MSALQKALAASQKKISSNNAKPSGRIILQPTEFTDKTVKGTVLSGQAKGQEIEVALSGKLTAKDYTGKRNKSYVDIEKGGTLRIERVKEGRDGVYQSGWIRTFNGKPNENDTVHPDAVVKLVDLNRRDAEDRPIMRMNQLMMDDQAHVTSFDEFEKGILDALSAEKGVMLYAMDDGEVSESLYTLGGKKDGDTFVYADPAERTAEIMDSLAGVKDVIEATLAGSGFSIVPVRSYMVGGDTAVNMEIEVNEAAENGRRPNISTIDPLSFNVPTIGQRVQFAINATGDNAMAEGAAEKLKAAFLDYADDADKEKFLEGGWGSMSNDTLSKFFEAHGAPLAKHPAKGWSTQAMLEIRPFDNMDLGLAVKSFALSGAAPYPAVEACKEARAAFYSEMKDAAEAVVEGLRAGVAADKAEVKAAAAEAEQEAEIADAEDSLDDLLNEMDAEMDPS
jgi:hypothetical protein